jgi:hypothetical protein
MLEDEKRGIRTKNGPDPKVLDAALKIKPEDLVNIYDHGFMKNLKEVIYT